MNPSTSHEAGQAVRVSFRLLARYFPFHPPPGKETATLAQLAPTYTRWEIANVLLVFACAPFTIWGGVVLLRKILPSPPVPAGALYHVSSDPAFMILPAIFIGLVLAAAPVMGGMKLLLRGRFPDYVLYGNLKVGFDATKVWFFLSAVITAGALALAAAAAPVHFSILPDHLELRDVGYSPAREIPFSHLATVVTGPAGRIELAFTDGTHWSSADNWNLLTLSPDVAPLLAQKARAARH